MNKHVRDESGDMPYCPKVLQGKWEECCANPTGEPMRSFGRHHFTGSADRRYYRVEHHGILRRPWVWIGRLPYPGNGVRYTMDELNNSPYFHVNTWGYHHYKHTKQTHPDCSCSMEAVMD